MEFIKKNKWEILNIIGGVFLALIPFVLIPVCPRMPNGKYMACHYSGMIITFAGIWMSLTGTMNIVIKNRKKFIVYISNIIFLVLSYLISTGIINIFNNSKRGIKFGRCMVETMACRVSTFPITDKLIFLFIFINLIALIWQFVGEKN